MTGRKLSNTTKAAKTAPKRTIKKPPPAKSKTQIAIDLLLDKAYRYKELSSSKKKVEHDLTAVRKDILDQLDNDPHLPEGRIEGEIHGVMVAVSKVTPTSIEYDVDGLREAVGPEMWDRLTVQVFSPKLLEDAISSGMIDSEEVVQYVKEVAKASYPKIS